MWDRIETLPLRSSIRREVDGAGTVHAFTYDQLSQLIAESYPDFGTYVYQYDKLGNRTQRNHNGTIDWHGYQDGGYRLQWMNRASNSLPISGQSIPYTLFSYDGCGRVSQRDRRDDNLAQHVYALSWDGDDRLRKITESGTDRLRADYNGDGLRT